MTTLTYPSADDGTDCGPRPRTTLQIAEFDGLIDCGLHRPRTTQTADHRR